MAHQKPHLSSGLCECDCRKCTVPAPDGVDVCVCAHCDAQRCGMHSYPGRPFDD